MRLDNILSSIMTGIYKVARVVMLTTLEDVFSVPDRPHHPTLQSWLPYTSFGQSGKATCRCCQILWFEKWNWLHYQASTDCVFCHTCCKALIERRWKYQSSFTISGFSNWNWKEATRAFKKHDNSKVHKHGVESYTYILPSTTKDIRWV